MSLDYSDLLLMPAAISRIASRKEVNLVSKSFGGVPIIAANMDGVGTFKVAEVLSKHKVYTCLVKHYTAKDWQTLPFNQLTKYLIPSTGINEVEKTLYILKDVFYAKTGKYPDYVCFDVANGHSIANIDKAVEFSDKVRALPSSDAKLPEIIYGNVANPEILTYIEEEYGCPFDCIKVGIGSGSVCTTRLKTGVGVPQATATIQFTEKVDALKLPIKIISDGGCRTPGHVALALTVGADAVMLGGMLSGSEESGKVFEGKQERFVRFYGNASDQSESFNAEKKYVTTEGKVVEVPFKGSMDSIIRDILGGLASTCAYMDALGVDDLFYSRSSVMTVGRQVDNYQ